MTLTIIEYGGKQQQIECKTFEFRCNQVSNWIRIKKADGCEALIHNVCVIKTQAESDKEKDVNCTDLCKSCNTKGCIFQSGIARSHCDFYKAESKDKE